MTDDKLFMLSVLDEGTPLILHRFGEDRVVELHETGENMPTGLIAVKDGGSILCVNISDVTVPDGIIQASEPIIQKGLRKLRLTKLRETVKDRETARIVSRSLYAEQ